MVNYVSLVKSVQCIYSTSNKRTTYSEKVNTAAKNKKTEPLKLSNLNTHLELPPKYLYARHVNLHYIILCLGNERMWHSTYCLMAFTTQKPIGSHLSECCVPV